MGQAYSEEVKDFRKNSKKEAKELGFLPNKPAMVHPLNKVPEQSRDPRSALQVQEWDNKTWQRSAPSPLSVVVDIMEARRIGIIDLEGSNTNCIALKFEILTSKGLVDSSSSAKYRIFSESKGSRYERWIDNFHIAYFSLPNSSGELTPIVDLSLIHI